MFRPATFWTQRRDVSEIIDKLHIWDLVDAPEDQDNLKNHFWEMVAARPKPAPHFGKGVVKNGGLIPVRIDWDY